MSSPLNQSREDLLSMILVMGVTGAGKSYFINCLADGEVAQTGADLKSCIGPGLCIQALKRSN